MTTHEKRLQLAIRNHTINVLRECATQTHTDWEKYVKKSEAKAMKEFQALINQARKEAAIEELERLKHFDSFNEPYTWQGDERPGKLVDIRIKALKEDK